MRFFLWSCLLFPFITMAQHRCGTMEKTSELSSDSSFVEGRRNFLAMAQDFELGSTSASRDNEEFVIPVVVHVVYNDSQDNISMAQIHSQIEVLNRDYNLLNADQSQIPEPFQPFKATANIRFVLADKDPDGNFTNGVTRTQTSIEEIGDTDNYYRSGRGGMSPWPQPHYLNVWVCRIGGFTLGFSILPSSNMSPRDGIVMDPRAFGTMGTARPPYDGGRTMVHEVGHYLGLLHPWGDEEGSCSNTDYMSDTPNQFDANSGCQAFPSFSCQGTDHGDMFMNYMDYATDSCMFLFTQRQVDFMRLVLRTSRSGLAHSPGVTGVSQLFARDYFLYPNPAESRLHIEWNQPPIDIPMYSLEGALIEMLSLQQGLNRFDFSHLTRGVYVLKFPENSEKLVLR